MTRTFTLDRPIPQVLTKRELADATGYSVAQIDRFRKLRNHPAIDELPGPGQPRFSGKAVKAWIDGGKTEPVKRRFFQKAG